ncbi:hypothetical protein PINS_up009442 [Pythium insidiosum]|nr:hypothetical protein PINS_up009442 [Pythium insidiosum]
MRIHRHSTLTHYRAIQFVDIGPFEVIKAIGDTYTLQLPPNIRLHPTFYVSRLQRYLASENLAEDLREHACAPALQSAPGSPRETPHATFREPQSMLRARRPSSSRVKLGLHLYLLIADLIDLTLNVRDQQAVYMIKPRNTIVKSIRDLRWIAAHADTSTDASQ